MLTRFTFTDLAQMMCQVPRSYHDSDTSSSDDEYEEGTGYRSEPSGRSYHVSILILVNLFL